MQTPVPALLRTLNSLLHVLPTTVEWGTFPPASGLDVEVNLSEQGRLRNGEF